MSTNQPIEPGAMVVRESSSAVARADDFMPLLSVEQAVHRKQQINQFIAGVLSEGKEAGEGDYGVMPGTKKKVLFKPGAEKLCSIFGLAPKYVDDLVIEDWTGAEHNGEPLFYYRYRCQLYRGDRFMGESIGSANSWEVKYRFRWVAENDVPAELNFAHLPTRGGERKIFEPDFALEKRETTGKYGKPEAYWLRFDEAIAAGVARPTEKKLGQRVFKGYEITVNETLYRVPNPDVADTINTLQKMAQKRSLVAAVLIVTNASDSFTQDMEDFQHHGGEGFDAPVEEKKPAGKPATNDPAELGPIFERIAKHPNQFGDAVKLFEQRLADKFGSVEGLARYDKVADEFYRDYPSGTRDVEVMKGVIRRLYAELERPIEAQPETVKAAS